MAVYVKSAMLAKLHKIKHGFFKRNGGTSTGIYQSLNCGTYSNDQYENVLKNRSIACSALSNNAKLIEIHQTHSNNVHIYENQEAIPDADAIVTDQRNIALSVVTADCAPVLFADENAGVIGAAHAGWKGAYTGILANTLSKMCQLGAEINNISAVIGPCISQTSYEVGPEFFEKIQDEKYFLKSTNEGYFQFNLENYVYDKLKETGLNNIEALNRDTYPLNNDFFSYRRKTHLNEEDYGRQISIILQN